MKICREETYVYIDVSNIRAACFASLNFRLDFVKLYEYIKKRYPNVKDIRYYEGISANDEKKRKYFEFLQRNVGYTICKLERKTYVKPAIYKNFNCARCGFANDVKVLSRKIMMKSNVDVYLATDMVAQAAKSKRKIRIVLFACDGDYAEAIKNVIFVNERIRVDVFATPKTRENNRLSIRLMDLCRELPSDNYRLTSIDDIKRYVAKPSADT